MRNARMLLAVMAFWCAAVVLGGEDTEADVQRGFFPVAVTDILGILTIATVTMIAAGIDMIPLIKMISILPSSL